MTPTQAVLLRSRALVAVALALCMASVATVSLCRAEEAGADTSLVGTAAPFVAPADSAVVSPTTAADATALTNARLMVVSRRVKLIGKGDHVVRTGPGEGFAIAGVFQEDESFPVIAKKDEWYGVTLSGTETGWVHRSLCKELDDLGGLEFKPNPRAYSRTGAYTLSGYAGAYAYDRKSNSLVAGGRLGYYVFDRLQAEAGVAWTHVRRPAEIVESLFDVSLEAEDFHMLFYNMNVTFEVLPGRQMVPFITAGVGSTIMLGRSESSVNYGAGTTLFLSRRSAMRWEVRSYQFDSGSDNARLQNHNIEFSLGTQILF